MNLFFQVLAWIAIIVLAWVGLPVLLGTVFGALGLAFGVVKIVVNLFVLALIIGAVAFLLRRVRSA